MSIATVTLRQPTDQDGYWLHQLVKRCPPLDTNSVYCNLLQCTDFANTAIAAEDEAGNLVGFISGYRPPQRPESLFVWQVAVDSSMRGQGLAGRMLHSLVARLYPLGVRYIETTISPGNAASQALFLKVFAQLDIEYTTSTVFSSQQHFNGEHEDEVLYRAGPICAAIDIDTDNKK